jgi:Na+-translocating ferredoxin:NAD+ oxidoreductase RnfG subunit
MYEGNRSFVNVLKKYHHILFFIIFFSAMASIIVVFENLTRDLVFAQRDQETLNLFRQIFPETESWGYDEKEAIYTIYDEGKNQLGYIFYAQGMSYMGFAGPDGAKSSQPMTILVGIVDNETIQNIVVVQQFEDKAYWDMLIRKDFLYQFNNLKIEDCDSKRFGGVIDTVTGATISCDSVIDIVREAAQEKAKLIG